MRTGLYSHFKTGKIYEVLCMGEHTETGEQLVVYCAPGESQTWIRPKAMFEEVVEHNGKSVPRFSRLT